MLVTVLAATGLAVVTAASASAETPYGTSDCAVADPSACATAPEAPPEEVVAPAEEPAPTVAPAAPESNTAAVAAEQPASPEPSASSVYPDPSAPAATDPYSTPPVDPYAPPVRPGMPRFSADACASPGGTAAVTVQLSGLTVGRTYVIEADGVVQGGALVATAATATRELQLTVGEHTVSVTDSGDSYLRASGIATVAECAIAPAVVAITADTCVAQGQSGSVDAELSSLVNGRDYRLEFFRDGQSVSVQDIVGTTSTQVVPFTGLAPGAYRVTITDVAEYTLTASADVVLTACAIAPTISIAAVVCDADTATSTIEVTLGDLVAGDVYTVTLVSHAGGVPVLVDSIGGIVTPVDTATFLSVANDVPYVVSVTNSSGYLTASTEVTPEDCGGELPVVVVPPVDPPVSTPLTPAGQLPTLALGGSLVTTGSEPVWPLLGSLAFLSLGAVLLTVTAARRRKEVGA